MGGRRGEGGGRGGRGGSRRSGDRRKYLSQSHEVSSSSQSSADRSSLRSQPAVLSLLFLAQSDDEPDEEPARGPAAQQAAQDRYAQVKRSRVTAHGGTSAAFRTAPLPLQPTTHTQHDEVSDDRTS